jgi:hypothetical protein
MVRLLVKKGTKKEAKNDKNKTPLTLAKVNYGFYIKVEPNVEKKANLNTIIQLLQT